MVSRFYQIFFINDFPICKISPDLYFVKGNTHKFPIDFLSSGYLYSKYRKNGLDIILFARLFTISKQHI